MTSLLTNTAAMTALTTLKSINSQLDTTSNRVSTGQRVSSAADNAAYWSIATTVRTDNASLSAVKDSLGLGSSAVDTAYNGLTSVLGDLQNLRAKLQTALTPGVDRAKVQVEIAAIQNKMKATADASGASGQNWLSVNSADTDRYRATQNIAAGFSRDITGAVALTHVGIPVSEIALYDAAILRVAVPPTPARITAGSAMGGLVDFSGGQEVRFTVSLDGGAGRDIVLNATTLASAVPDLAHVAAQDLATAINDLLSADAVLGGNVRAALDGQGRLYFETVGTGAARSLVIDRTSSGTVASGSNAVSNGGFESGLAGWSISGDTAYVSAGPPAHGGTRSLALGTVSGTTLVSRTITTVPGQSYQVEFWLDNSGGTPNRFQATWNGASLLALNNAPGQGYTHYSFTVVAGGPSATLGFEAQQVPGFWHLDDVAVTDTPANLTLGFGSGASDHASGYGSVASVLAARGVLDTVDGGTGVSIQTMNILNLGGDGDAGLRALVDQLEGVIARVTDGGTRLGASKTRISGQITFLDTLMKTNARTIGTLADADIELEATRVKAFQTQQQLALQSLSIANASNQTLMTLFRQ